MTARRSDMPRLRLSRADWEALPEYSATLPTGPSPGFTWKAQFGKFDPTLSADVRSRLPWLIGAAGNVIARDEKRDGTTVRLHWFRPVIICNARDCL